MNQPNSTRPSALLRPGGRQPLLWAALAFAAGLWAGLYMWWPPLWWIVAGGVFAASGIYFAHPRHRAGFALGLGTVLVAGALIIQVRSPNNLNNASVLQFADGREVLVTAHVMSEGNLQEEGSGDVRQSLDVETEEIAASGETVRIRSGLRVSLYGKQVKNEEAAGVTPIHLFRYGERLRLLSKLNPPRNFRNPGAFDYQGYLAENGIAALASTKVWNGSQAFPAIVRNSGAAAFISASLRKSMHCGRRGRPHSWMPWLSGTKPSSTGRRG
jgi:hypothetical protein